MSARFSPLFFVFVPFAILLLGAASRSKDDTPAATLERKLFTLKSDKILLSEALVELAKQTGIRVEDVRREPDQSIHLDLKQVSFWQALDVIAAAGNARVNLYPSSGRIVLDKRTAAYRLPPISYDGRFRLSVKNVFASRDLEINDNEPNSTAYNVAFEVAWDPLLQPLFLETRPHAVRLMDDKNKVYDVPDDGSSPAPVGGRLSLDLNMRLPALPRSVAKISKLEGKLSMIGPSKMLTFNFDTLEKLDKTKVDGPERRLTQEGVTCQIRKVTLDKERWTVQVAIDYPPGMKQLDSNQNQSWVVNNELVWESTDGKKRFTRNEYVLESSPPRAVLSYHFRDKDGIVRGNPAGWKVSYRTPANLIEVPIKFSFKDILLP